MNYSPSKIVERLLADRIGLDPSSVGSALIARGIHARMAALGIRSIAEYDRVLIEPGDEVQALVEEVVVPESWFFRDDRPFEVLANLARDGWQGDPARPPLRALSLPCASGEEPYSIAMTLLEAGLDRDRFRVDAVDVSTRSVARAIAGVYSSNAFRGTRSPARSSYFHEQNGIYTIDAAVRSSVRFHLGNLLDDRLFADHPPFDVVFCRNLLIYLDEEARARAFANLDRMIVDGGFLFLGHADRLDLSEKTPFQATADKGAFVFRKGGAAVSRKLETAPTIFPGRPGPTGATTRRSLSTKTEEGRVERSHRHRVPAPVILTSETIPQPPPTSPTGRESEKKGQAATPAESAAAVLDRASGLADLGRYGEATGLVETLIRNGGAGASAYFLLGLVAQAVGHRDRAESHYLKAIYLDPQHDEALLAMASLARRKGDIAGEAAYRKRADRVLSRKGKATS